VCPDTVVIIAISSQDSLEVSGAKNDDMVQAFAPNRTDDAFCVRFLPRRTISGNNVLDAESLSPSGKLFSVNRIAITEQILGPFVHAAGLLGAK